MLAVDTLTLNATDGYQLAATRYQSTEKANTSIVLINSAMGVQRGYYQSFAKYLANKGMIVITWDYRGISDSLYEPVASFSGWMHEWGEKDLVGVIDWIKENHPGLPINCIGHSVGAQLVGLASNNQHISTFIGIAGQKGYWGHWQGLMKLKVWLSMHLLLPGLVRFKGFLPGKLLNSCDLPKNVALQWAQWCRNKHFVVDQQGNANHEHFISYPGKLIAYSFYDDELFAPPAAVDALSALYTSANVTRRHIDQQDVNDNAVGHFGFFRTQFRKSLWQDVLKHLNQPSTASRNA